LSGLEFEGDAKEMSLQLLGPRPRPRP